MKLILLIGLMLSLNLYAQTKIACVGDSITFGAGIKQREKNCYPAQLQNLLGAEYTVRNFGVSARTMLRKGDRPYIKEKAYRDSLAFNPNIVIIKLGTNDAKPKNWRLKAQFSEDVKALIKSYRDLPSKPRIILCLPAPVMQTRWKITEKTLRNEVAPLIRKVAIATEVEVFDFHPALKDHPGWFPDGVHPNAAGAKAMAVSLHEYLVKK